MDKQNINAWNPDVELLIEHMAHGFAYCRMQYENNRPCDFTYLMVNPAFGKITGLNGVVGKKASEVIPGILESNPELFEIYGRVALTGRTESFESFVSGLRVWFAVTVYSPQKDYFVATFEDITERKLAENTLRESNEIAIRAGLLRDQALNELQAINDNAMIGIGISTINSINDRVLIRANHYLEVNMFGYEHGELVGKPVRTLYASQEDFDEVGRTYIPQFISSKGSCVYESKFVRKDGTTFFGRGKVTYVDPAHYEKGVITLLQDITEERLTEEKLRRSEEKFRTVFDTSSDMLMMLDEKGFFDANKAAVIDSGCSSVEEFCSKSPADLAPPFQPCGTSSEILANQHIATAMRKGFHHFEWINRRINGETFPSEVTLTAMEQDGKQFLLVTTRDISERKLAEQALIKSMRQLEEKELAKSRFLAAAGHDLRQPLAAANLFIDALKYTETTSDQNQIIQRLDQAMSNFNDLLDALLNVSKLDAGIIKPEFTSINVAEIFNWLEESFAPLVNEKHIQFKLYFPMKESLSIHSDIGLLKSVLMNLVSNAIKFTSKGGILVSARKRGSNVLFQIWDTGMGIVDVQIGKIFDEFYQINNPQRDRTSGLGLGLAIAKRALALLDAEITCHSQVGRGSVFEFYLPIVNTSSNAIHDTTTLEPKELDANRSFVQGKRFVVLEDDTMVSEALCKSLEIMGGEVECFDNAEYALQHPKIGNADCYIVDYMLPGDVDGISFLLRLHQQLNKHVCAVMMSGNTSSYFIRNADFFSWPVVHKPVNLSKLISRLKETYRGMNQ